MAEVLTVPSEEPEMDPTHKYTLRGVITSADVVYMCRRREADPPETEASSSAKVDQWWRCAWVAGDENPVRQEVCTALVPTSPCDANPSSTDNDLCQGSGSNIH